MKKAGSACQSNAKFKLRKEIINLNLLIDIRDNLILELTDENDELKLQLKKYYTDNPRNKISNPKGDCKTIDKCVGVSRIHWGFDKIIWNGWHLRWCKTHNCPEMRCNYR